MYAYHFTTIATDNKQVMPKSRKSTIKLPIIKQLVNVRIVISKQCQRFKHVTPIIKPQVLKLQGRLATSPKTLIILAAIGAFNLNIN